MPLLHSLGEIAAAAVAQQLMDVLLVGLLDIAPQLLRAAAPDVVVALRQRFSESTRLRECLWKKRWPHFVWYA